MAKKENNNKNWRSHEAFKAHQKENRPKQVWVPHSVELMKAFNTLLGTTKIVMKGSWKHYDVPEDEQ